MRARAPGDKTAEAVEIEVFPKQLGKRHKPVFRCADCAQPLEIAAKTGDEVSSRPEGSHLRALLDPYVNLSIHTAPDVSAVSMTELPVGVTTVGG
jgi:hypothetical protein